MKFLLVASFGKSIIGFRGELIESIQSLGNQVHILFPNSNHENICNTLKEKGFKVHDFKINRKGTSLLAEFLSLFRLYFQIRSIKPDILFSYTIKPVIYTGLVSMLLRIPRRYSLITGLGYAFQHERGRFNFTQFIAQAMYRIALRGVTKVFFQNPDDQRLFHDEGILLDHIPSIVVNGSGVDLKQYKPTDLPDEPSFLLIGRLLKAKGILEFIEAAQMIASENNDVSFKIAGWRETGRDSISQEIIDSWKENYSIKYLGPLLDVRSSIAKASVFVLPSYREGTPRTVLEAMAMGRPIITTDVPGCRETVIDGYNGFLIPPRNSMEIAVAMRRFISDPKLANKMGKRSRQIAEKKYDVRSVNDIILKEMSLK